MATPIPENRARFTLAEVLEAIQGTLANAADFRGSLQDQVQGVCIDSRKIKSNHLFVALKGQNHDGHAYIERVVASGVAAVIVHKPDVVVPDHVAKIQVQDSLVALGALAAFHRKRWGGTLVAITGSAGKTSTRTMVASALETLGGGVAQTVGNLNNLIGAPMTLLTLDSERFAAIEIGTSQPGEIKRLTEITEPDIGVITLVSAAHTEGLGDVESVIVEKTSLWEGLKNNAVAMGPADDSRLLERLRKSPTTKKMTFGKNAAADVQLLSSTIEKDGKTWNRFKVGEEILEGRFSLLGATAAMNASTALCVLSCLGGDLSKGIQALSAVEPIEGRLCPKQGPHDVLILDDSYNANPKSTESAIEAASELSKIRGGKLWVAMGDMKELGALTTQAHQQVIEQCIQQAVQCLIGFGEQMQKAIHAFNTDSSFSKPALISAHTHEEISEILFTQTAPQDVVLIKGSRSMHMDQIVSSFLVQEVSA